jgi:hypothetical protein
MVKTVVARMIMKMVKAAAVVVVVFVNLYTYLCIYIDELRLCVIYKAIGRSYTLQHVRALPWCVEVM